MSFLGSCTSGNRVGSFVGVEINENFMISYYYIWSSGIDRSEFKLKKKERPAMKGY